MGSASAWISLHQFDLPKCQVHRGNAAKCLNGHSGDLIVYFLHFAPKTSERTIDDPYDLTFAHLPMSSHTAILFSYGLRLPVPGKRVEAMGRLDVPMLAI
jgi:hypothetical protein